jgi:hypothetical protein
MGAAVKTTPTTTRNLPAQVMRFFAALRMTTVQACHSERSEESHTVRVGGLRVVVTVISIAWACQTQAADLSSIAPLVSLFSGHIAVLPDPSGQNLSRSVIGQTLASAGLMRHVVFLTKEQFVDPNFFNAQRFPVALYLSGEVYLQTVRREGDGDEALLRFLKDGGTLLVLPTGPFPFFYNQAGGRAGAAAKFGMNTGAGSFEAAPAGRKLTFHLNTEQKVISSLPATFPFPSSDEADQRWRPIVGASLDSARYVPILTLKDETGRSYGEGVALVEHGNARVFYVWCSLMANEDTRQKILHDTLRFALSSRMPPPAQMACYRTSSPPKIDGQLNDAVWQNVASSGSLRRLGAQPQEPSQPTTVKACWDNQNLYLAFECAGLNASGDAVQVWFDPDGDGKGRPQGAMLQTLIVNSQNEITPAGVQSAVRVEGTTWTAEVAIPFAWFKTAKKSPPKLGHVWLAQFARFAGKAAEVSVWSITDSVNRADRFGSLTFAADPYSDDFDSYEEPSDGSPIWNIMAGRWKVDNGTFVGEDCGTDGIEARGAMRGDSSWRDYVFSVRFKIESRSSDWRDGPWFGVRCDREGDGYFLNFSDRDAQLHKVTFGYTTGEPNCLAKFAWQPDDKWHTLKIEARANWLKGELDGKKIFEVKDDAVLNLPSIRSGGIILAARKWSGAQGKMVVRFDDVEVRLLDLPANLPE